LPIALGAIVLLVAPALAGAQAPQVPASDLANAIELSRLSPLFRIYADDHPFFYFLPLLFVGMRF
jgi:hypothetical protein